jgi:hypothetical protein
MINVGIRKDIKKLLEDLELTAHRADSVYIEDVVQRLEEILRNNKKKKKPKEQYIVVKKLAPDDNGNTSEAIKDGYGLPKIGYKYVKILK